MITSRKPAFRFRNVIIMTLALSALLMAGASSKLYAQSGPSLKPVILSKTTHEAYAALQAKQQYKDYLKSLNLKYDEDTKAYARFLPLGTNSDRFVAFYILGQMNAGCPPLGCEFLVFETRNKSAQPVMSVFAHNVWIGESPGQGAPRDIYTQSYYISGPGQGGHIYRWQWDGEKYKNEGIHRRR